MALNTTGIVSNIKAQSQKIYRTVKTNIVEEGLLTNNIDKAINKVSAKAKDGYDDTVKAINAVKQDIPTPADPEGLLDTLKGISKDKKGTISGIGSQMSEDQANKVKEAAAMRMVKKNTGLNSDDNMKTYEGVLKATKGAVAGNTVMGMGDSYFVQPFRDLGNAKKIGDKSSASEAISKIATRVGVTGAGIGAVAGAGSILSNNDNEIMRY